MASGPGDSPYVKPRIWAGLAVTATAIVLALVDVMRTDVTVDGVQFALLLGTGLAMLGLDAGRKLLG